MTNEREPKNYTLILAFDLDQINGSLQFNVQNDNCAMLQTIGRAAGSYHFQPKDTVNIEIIASFDKNKHDDPEITIQDMTLVCLPASRAWQSNLSPFFSDSAGLILRNWVKNDTISIESPKRPKELEGCTKFVYFSRDPATDPAGDLTVQPHSGQWLISGFLSVKVDTKKAGTKKHKGTFCRVFEFDPSVIVGTGRDED